MISSCESRFGAGAHLKGEERQKRDKSLERINDRIEYYQKRRKATLDKIKNDDEKARKSVERYKKMLADDMKRSRQRLEKRRKDIAKQPEDQRKKALAKAESNEKRYVEQAKRNRQRSIDNANRQAKNNINRTRNQAAQYDKQMADLVKQRNALPAVGGNPSNWQHMLHPLWSHDPIWVPFVHIRTRWAS